MLCLVPPPKRTLALHTYMLLLSLSFKVLSKTHHYIIIITFIDEPNQSLHAFFLLLRCFASQSDRRTNQSVKTHKPASHTYCTSFICLKHID